jgi:hypothetical protein
LSHANAFSVAGALIATCLLAALVSAAPWSGALSKNLTSPTQSSDDSLVIQVRHRRCHGLRGGNGAAIAVGVVGGVILGTIIATQAQRQQGVEYCMRRNRGYDPGSMTYVGRDGLRHSCP